MAYYITVPDRKGGVGKTTTCLNLQGYFNTQGLSTVIVDYDPQGSATKLYDLLGGNNKKKSLISHNEFKTVGELKSLTKDFDIVIIDTPPFFMDEISDILSISNLAIIPSKTSPLDLFEVKPTVEYIEEARKKNPKLKHVILFTMTIPGSTLANEMRPDFELYGKVLKSEIGNKADYIRSLVYAPSLESKAKNARKEIQALGDELINIISNEN